MMFAWLTNFFTAKPKRLISQAEVKRLLCVPELVDNPALLHVSSERFIVPSLLDVERKLSTFRAGASYNEHFRCIHFARRLASHFAGTGWAVGLITIGTGHTNAHQLVSVIVDNNKIVFIDAEKKQIVKDSIEILWGEIA